MKRHLFRPLDRYVFAEFTKIFLMTALGFPFLLVVIDLTDHVQGYLDKHIPVRDVALSYLFWMPDSMFMVLPAAVLFATVFSIGAMTRHAEITAAKASGISFYRLIFPIIVAAAFACVLDVGLGEVVPITNQQRSRLLREDKAQQGSERYNFAFASEAGRVYNIFELRTAVGVVRKIEIERKGKGPTYPTYVLQADSGAFKPAGDRWTLYRGVLHVLPDSMTSFDVSFAVGRDIHFREHPTDMMLKPPDPHNMRYEELSRMIAAGERSGEDVNASRVERALKLAVPATCIIIALFGAPLATSTKRGGSAYGIAVSLATTMIFLLFIQLTRAIGSKGVVSPDFAAWIPGIIFASIGLVLLSRVRT